MTSIPMCNSTFVFVLKKLETSNSFGIRSIDTSLKTDAKHIFLQKWLENGRKRLKRVQTVEICEMFL